MCISVVVCVVCSVYVCVTPTQIHLAPPLFLDVQVWTIHMQVWTIYTYIYIYIYIHIVHTRISSTHIRVQVWILSMDYQCAYNLYTHTHISSVSVCAHIGHP